jgi:hypothetical protein
VISFPRRRVAAALLAVAAGFACSRDNPSAPPSLQGIVVIAPDSTIFVGQTVTASAVGVNQFGDTMALKDTKWSSNPSTVATVDTKGVVTALQTGTVTITAKSGGKSGDLSLSISNAPAVLTTINVAVPTMTITLGQKITATAAGVDQYGAAFPLSTIAWSAAPADVATIDATGLVTPIKAGTVQITATVGSSSGSTTVAVTNPPAVVINEIESNGDTNDWVEIFNPTAGTVDLTGWVVKDNDNTHAQTLGAGSTIAAGGYLVVLTDAGANSFGLGAPDSARLYNPFGVEVDKWGWDTHSPTTLGRCPNGTGAFVVTTSSTRGKANDCSNPVKINEVESSGGTPGDWIELYNPSGRAIDLSGYILKDSIDTHIYTIATGTTIAPGQFLAFDVDTTTGGKNNFGLGGNDMARFFTPDGVLLDSYQWTSAAATTYGRCPDGTGAFVTTASSTKNAKNDCGTTTPTGPVASAWPGSNTVNIVDDSAFFGTNLSGLEYETLSPNVMWAVKNGPSTLYRLIFNGSVWTPDPSNGWGTGKQLRYTDGTGDPDAEGVTISMGGSATGVYVSTERNNSNSGVSRPAVLRFDVSSTDAELRPTNDWNLSADFPGIGANLGLEGVTFVPDAYLTANGFFDEHMGHAYNPAEYPNHAGGLFFVALEQTGGIFAYALDHSGNNFQRVSAITTTFTAGVMDLHFDRELNYLFAICDDTCGGLLSTWEIDTNASSATKGHFVMTNLFNRPSGMGNFNNEGFTVKPLSLCVGGQRDAYWSDDTGDAGHSIRQATLPCARFTTTPNASLLRKK